MSNSTHFYIPYFDNYETTLRSALGWCEEYCVAVCCGMNAFNITAKNMQDWADRVTHIEVGNARRQAAETLTLLRDAPQKFDFLGEIRTREEVIEWFEAVQEALADVKPGDPTPST